MESLDAKAIAWIFYATDMAMSPAGAVRTDISHAADAINHAVPLDKELNGSLRCLLECGLISQTGKRYMLTSAGASMIGTARERGNTVFAVWDALAELLVAKGLGSNNSFEADGYAAAQFQR
jgi:hypothetical protein